MSSRNRMGALGLLVGLGLLGSASPGAQAATLGSLKMGEYWYGPNLSLEDLKGRVVLVEFWGQH